MGVVNDIKCDVSQGLLGLLLFYGNLRDCSLGSRTGNSTFAQSELNRPGAKLKRAPTHAHTGSLACPRPADDVNICSAEVASLVAEQGREGGGGGGREVKGEERRS